MALFYVKFVDSLQVVPYVYKGKGKGLGTCYCAAYETRNSSALQSRKWQMIGMIPRRIMRPSIPRDGEQLDPH